MSSTSIQTYSGQEFNFSAESFLAAINVQDIAHALSNQCRFNGHTTAFYSVAQHSVIVSQEIQRRGYPNIDALWGLIHDASEAYVGDLVAPLKTYLRNRGNNEFAITERHVQFSICVKLGIPIKEPEVVKLVDSQALYTEMRDLLVGGIPTWLSSIASPCLPLTIVPMSPREARIAFLQQFRSLGGES